METERAIWVGKGLGYTRDRARMTITPCGAMPGALAG
jgi:hypothetical protein